jgi:hypothetical protein
MKDSKPSSPGDREVGGLDLAEYGCLRSGPKRGDRLHPAPVLVAKREAIQQVLDRDEACTFEVGRFARTDTFEKLKRSSQRIR